MMCTKNIAQTRATAATLCMLTANLVANGAQALPGETGIVPKPVKLEVDAGTFLLSAQCNILYQKNSPGAKATAEFLAETWREVMRLPLPVQAASELKRGSILLTTAGAEASLGKEGYRLEVTPEGVVIKAPQPAGLFYGVQTLRQLLPAETFGSSKILTGEPFAIPCVRVEDYPRFGWRGMHLDVSRHFFDVQFVKRYLDHLALHKINVFHWHLTDDDGWRVEIKKYPKLTQVGAWRGPKEALPPSYESGNQRYGGFYTQAQIREVIRYAAARHILIVPEIDVPAHCRAAIVAYPELLCTGDPYKFKSAQDVSGNVLCPSQELTYKFVEGVFGELADLFPGPYIHAGGDERPKGPWEQCDRCEQRMKDEHLADGRFLQDRFLRRLQGFLKAHGKTMVGWDELEQESVLDKDYVVMAWQSVEAGVAAARKGYPVVMTSSPFTYFDLAYSEDSAEPGLRWAGVISVEKAYSFDPKPSGPFAGRGQPDPGRAWLSLVGDAGDARSSRLHGLPTRLRAGGGRLDPAKRAFLAGLLEPTLSATSGAPGCRRDRLSHSAAHCSAERLAGDNHSSLRWRPGTLHAGQVRARARLGDLYPAL